MLCLSRDSEEEQNRLAEELAKNTQEMQKNIQENELRILQLSEDWKQEAGLFSVCYASFFD